MPQLKVQNFYSTALTSDIVGTGDTSFTVTVAPTFTSGFLVISPNNASLREIVYFHNVVGNTVSVRAENRWQGGTTARAHTSQEPVAMKDIAEIFNMFSDSISQCFFVEKTGGLTIKVWWGTVFYNGNPVTVADTALTLADNQTNYIKYSYPTNTISVDTTNSGNIKARVTTVSGAITSIQYYVAKESYIDFTVTITGALPSQTGNAGKVLITDGTNVSWGISNLPRTIWVNKHIVVDRPTGIEVIKDVTDGTTVAQTDKVRLQKASWNYEDFSYPILQSEINSSVFLSYVAWESLTQWDAVAVEYFWNIWLQNNTSVNVWDIAWRTRLYQQIIGSGVSMTTFTTTSVKVWTPTDTWTLTIETDDGTWKPSGTLAHANATATLAWASFGPGTDNTWTFTGAFTLTLGTKYHVVIKRQNAVDPANYITFNVKSKNTRCQWQGFHNGTSYQSATFTAPLACYGTGILDQYLIKASASFIETANCIWFSKDTVTAGQSVLVSNNLSTTGLTAWKYYFLSNTPGVVSLTSWNIKAVVWFSKSTTNVLFFRNIYNSVFTWSDSQTVSLGNFSVSNATLIKDYIFSDYGKLTISSSGSFQIGYRTDGVTTAALAATATTTITFEPNKVYTISFVGTAWTGTFALARTVPFNYANLIY